MEDIPDLASLNRRVSLEEYLKQNVDRLEFKFQLKSSIKQLAKHYEIKIMTKEDLLVVGLRQDNRTALALIILIEKQLVYSYDRAVHFKETIVELRRILVEELYSDKCIFYEVGEGVIALDPNYVPFILGQEINLEKLLGSED